MRNTSRPEAKRTRTSGSFFKGDPRIKRGGGRPPGSLNKATLARLANDEAWEASEELARTHGWQTPLQFLLREMNNPMNAWELRLRCAESAAPYVHRRMPTGIEIQTPVNETRVAQPSELERLSVDELSELLRITRKMKGTSDLTHEMAEADPGPAYDSLNGESDGGL